MNEFELNNESDKDTKLDETTTVYSECLDEYFDSYAYFDDSNDLSTTNDMFSENYFDCYENIGEYFEDWKTYFSRTSIYI